MFESTVVVQSAVSSFNNAALSAPTFFWMAVLMLPVFILTWKFGNDVLRHVKGAFSFFGKWSGLNFSFVTDFFILAWLILMAGNYNVLRDNASWLPYVVAGVTFLVTASFVQKSRGLGTIVANFTREFKWRKLIALVSFVALVAIVALSGAPTWWGALLQGSAFLCGVIAGRFWHRPISSVTFTAVIMFVLTALILMQPEFFRFGQLGNLTVIHLLFIILTGMLSVAVIVLRNVRARGRIRHSWFIKLKWLGRFVTALALILFILTESVPVFLGFAGVYFVTAAMSVWHQKSVPANLGSKLFGMLLCCFGIITSVHMITIIGILYWVNQPRSALKSDASFLL
ncbi:hypothetical protein LJC18_05460 [Lachnospiraceae bacterium OttesenSCG-928-E19]|nr:hypothetical protein [Lachnospiraceae bacterium OttesenSCG-928-E19]